jgi:hypothetical protein
MGPGAAIAMDLGNGRNTVRVDYTEAIFKFDSIAEQTKLRVPYSWSRSPFVPNANRGFFVSENFKNPGVLL